MRTKRGPAPATFAVIAALLGPAACSRHEHSHAEGGGHEHEHGGEHGGEHAHGQLELAGIAVTIWTERTELFMEHRPLIVGRETRFAAHVTELPSFKAVSDGTATITVRMLGGGTLTGRADAPSSPGIFRPAVTPEKAGACELSFAVAGPRLTDRFVVGPCEVFEDEADAFQGVDEPAEVPGRITFLKEQQWKTDFATIEVSERELRPSVRANGEILPAAGREARLTAPAAGRIVLPKRPPILGTSVAANQLLASLTPRLASGTDRASLEAEAVAARVELEAAEAQRARAERLIAEAAIPARSVEEANARAQTARARADAAAIRLAQFGSSSGLGASGDGRGAVELRSPIDGTLVEVAAASGATVEEGSKLFTVIDLSRVWVEARVFEPDIPKVETARFASFTVEGREAPFEIGESNGRLVTVGHVIDPKSRTVPVVFEVANPRASLRIGQFAKVSIQIGAPVRAPAIPESAIVDEAGRAVAFVQVGGESFERRPLSLGISDRGWIEVAEGLRPGEHVVTQGAYEIKLASASGVIPAHGHAH